MNAKATEKSHVFSDKRGQDRRQDTARAKKYKNNRRKSDRRNMEFSELPWWLQRNYVDSTISPVTTKPKKTYKFSQTKKAIKKNLDVS